MRYFFLVALAVIALAACKIEDRRPEMQARRASAAAVAALAAQQRVADSLALVRLRADSVRHADHDDR